jgi:hypothetical protein
MVVTFAVAIAAAGVGAAIRSNSTNARQLVVGFEALAVAVGVVGLVGGHYIPGTIVGVATLVTVLGTHDGPTAAPVAAPVAAGAGFATDAGLVPAPSAVPVAAADPAPTPAPLFAAAAAPVPPPPTPTEFAPAARAVTILPGQ